MANDNKKKAPAKKMTKAGMKKTKGGSFSFGSQAFNGPAQKVMGTGGLSSPGTISGISGNG